MMSNPDRETIFPENGKLHFGGTGESHSHLFSKIKQNPILSLATVSFLGIGGYRIYHIQDRGGMKISHFLIHTRLAAQGFAAAVLGSLVLYSLGKRAYQKALHIEEEEHTE